MEAVEAGETSWTTIAGGGGLREVFNLGLTVSSVLDGPWLVFDSPDRNLMSRKGSRAYVRRRRSGRSRRRRRRTDRRQTGERRR